MRRVPVRSVRHLVLMPIALVAMARGEWAPEPLELDGLRQFNSDYRGEMTVNAYLAWDAATGAAAIFDTGASADELLAAVEELGVEVKAVFTHSYPSRSHYRA